MSTNDNIWISFAWGFGVILGCGAIVLAANGLAWTVILPRLPEAQPQRRRRITAAIAVFAPLSVVVTFALVLGVIVSYQYWSPLIPWLR